MLEMDTLRLPPPISAIFVLRGEGVIPLVWSESPIRALKASLERAEDDSDLLGQAGIADESMAAAVRALLYLWGGWPSEALMHAALAAERESAYLRMFRSRQAGEPDAAKKLLIAIGEHATHPALAEFAREQVGASPSPALKRLRDVLDFGEQWEPFAFADVFEQARNEDIDGVSAGIVTAIQRREFELLLVNCLEAALGEKLNVFRDSQNEAQRAVRRMRTASAARAKSARHASAPAEKEQPAESVSTLGETVTVACPACRVQQPAPASMCGGIVACMMCGKQFRIPDR